METHNRYHIDVFVVFLFLDASSVVHFKCPIILGLFIILPCHLLLTSYVANFHVELFSLEILADKNCLYFVCHLPLKEFSLFCSLFAPFLFVLFFNLFVIFLVIKQVFYS